MTRYGKFMVAALMCAQAAGCGAGESIEYKLAALDAGTQIKPDDPAVARAKGLLDALSGCQKTRDQIGDDAARVHNMLAAEAVVVNRLDLLATLVDALPAAASGDDCESYLVWYAAKRLQGHDDALAKRSLRDFAARHHAPPLTLSEGGPKAKAPLSKAEAKHLAMRTLVALDASRDLIESAFQADQQMPLRDDALQNLLPLHAQWLLHREATHEAGLKPYYICWHALAKHVWFTDDFTNPGKDISQQEVIERWSYIVAVKTKCRAALGLL